MSRDFPLRSEFVAKGEAETPVSAFNATVNRPPGNLQVVAAETPECLARKGESVPLEGQPPPKSPSTRQSQASPLSE